jgi:hypothetical protein
MPLSRLETVNAMVVRFNTISLDEMDNVKLMDRIDSKFILPFSDLRPIVAELNGSYRILSIQDKKVFGYRTDYFDTPERVMYMDHHNGKLNRYKIRHREYVDTQLGFLEVKFRSNKGRITKERIEDRSADPQLFNGFIAAHTPYNPVNLSLTVINHFNRFTLVDNALRERVTIDFNLVFSGNSRDVLLKDLVIIEIKQDHVDKASTVFQSLKKHSLRPTSVSKYCVGLTLLNNDQKANYFKQTIMQINKLSHVEFTS